MNRETKDKGLNMVFSPEIRMFCPPILCRCLLSQSVNGIAGVFIISKSCVLCVYYVIRRCQNLGALLKSNRISASVWPSSFSTSISEHQKLTKWPLGSGKFSFTFYRDCSTSSVLTLIKTSTGNRITQTTHNPSPIKTLQQASTHSKQTGCFPNSPLIINQWTYQWQRFLP